MAEKTVAGETIVGTFVEHLEFKKKKVGGIDEMDALGKIEELAGLYEERIEALSKEIAQAKREAEANARRVEATAEVEAALARTKAELAEERVRAEGLAARLRALESNPAPVPAAVAAPASAPVTDDFMRTLQEVRADVLGKARDEATSIVSRARENAESTVRAERERRTRAVDAARTARGQVESAMRKLADALGDVEALESGLSTGSSNDFDTQEVLARLRRAEVPSPLDPWDSSLTR